MIESEKAPVRLVQSAERVCSDAEETQSPRSDTPVALERECVCVCVCVCVCERERESECVCVCVCESE